MKEYQKLGANSLRFRIKQYFITKEKSCQTEKEKKNDIETHIA